MRKILSILFILFLCVSAASQEKISGKVFNNTTREPLEGVTILVQNTSFGTTTDPDGYFEISVPTANEVLEFSCIGMISKEFRLDGLNNLTIYLEPDIFYLDDVVVTAIGIKREEKSLGYAVQAVESEQLQIVKNDNLVNSLSAKVAGVDVTGSSGQAGSSAFIMIRGAASLEGNNQPLFVVDGMPVSNTYLYMANNEVSNRIIDLNPDDIESVSVLKGGAATALYGMRAANGVVLITTKQGKISSEKYVQVSLNTSVTFEKASQLHKLQTKYGQGYDGNWISGNYGSWGPRLDTCSYSLNPSDWANPEYDVDGAIVSQDHPNATGEDIKIYDQYDIFRTAVSSFTSLNIMGGGENSAYQASTSYTYTEGIISENDWKRFTMKLSGETFLSESFKLFGSASYYRTLGNRIMSGGMYNGGDVISGMLHTPPTFDNENPFEFPDGSQRNYQQGGGFDNPYWSVKYNKLTDNVNRFIGFTGFNWKPLDWLQLDYKVGIDFFDDNWSAQWGLGSMGFPFGAVFYWSNNERQINSDLILSLYHQFNDDWSLGFKLGNNMFEFTKFWQSNIGIGLLSNDFFSIYNTSTTYSDIERGIYRNAAFYGDFEVDYKKTLYLSLTGRNEWSTTLPADNNSFFYPSASLAWIFTELPFLKANKAIPFGKLRFSFAGIANAPEMYKTYTYYEPIMLVDRWVFGLRTPLLGKPAATLSDSQGNYDLKPEKTTAWEIGANLRFAGNRISFDFTYFSNYSKNLLLNVPISASSGFIATYTNAGEMSSKGVEIVLSGSPVQRRNWQWSTNVNFSTYKNIVEELGPNVDMLILGGADPWLIIHPIVGAREGDDYMSLYGYDWLRDGDGNVIINDDPASPDYGFPIADMNSLVRAGKATPDWILGWGNTVKWKNLSFSFLLDVKQGGMMFNGTKGDLYYYGAHADQESREPGDLFVFEGVKESDGSPNDIQVVKDINWYNKGPGSTINGPSVPFIENSSWIRLREVMLSYRLDQKVLGDSFIKSLEVYFSGKNLWLSTEYTGIDPETSLNGATNAQGMDYYNVPGTRAYTIGLRASF